MKKLNYLFLLLMSVFILSCVSCSDDDDKPISTTDLPQAAMSFIKQYYGDTQIVSATKDTDDGTVEYDVILANGHKVTFNSSGEWIDVDAPSGQNVPDALVPEKIAQYVNTNYPGIGINEISKELYGYDIDLNNGTDLKFTADGDFIRADDNIGSDPVTVGALPKEAINFLTQYYPNIDVATVQRGIDDGVLEYEVMLVNGHNVTFNEAGQWLDIDAPKGKTIPDGIAPQKIVDYIKANYAAYGINEIAKEGYGYSVELTNDLDLDFSAAGDFLGIDR